MSLSGPMFAAAAPSKGPVGHSNLVQGDLQLRLDVGRATWRGRPVPVTGTELKMLHLMIHRQGEPVSYRELYDLVHGPGFMAGKGHAGYRANVRAFIKRIRKKFRDVDDGFDAIGNDPGTGYIWRD
ncbi:helix-turn-helix domain-containing protein [Niveispirillum sp. KHB5.9]|uniref:helix-turn-helix domain-containing protein n=1 Tax=Niveispirillum sp. KHB5.9 TaxID=3400269 RepID=UPI003A89E8E6